MSATTSNMADLEQVSQLYCEEVSRADTLAEELKLQLYRNAKLTRLVNYLIRRVAKQQAATEAVSQKKKRGLKSTKKAAKKQRLV